MNDKIFGLICSIITTLIGAYIILLIDSTWLQIIGTGFALIGSFGISAFSARLIHQLREENTDLK